jgi:penicillin-binding protein 2
MKRFLPLIITFGLVGCQLVGGNSPTSTNTPFATAPLPTAAIVYTTQIPTPMPSPKGTLVTFLDAWNKADYVGMYSLLSPLSQGGISQENFVKFYSEESNTLTFLNVEYEILSEFVDGSQAEIRYKGTIQTRAVGPLRTEYVVKLSMDGGRWGIAWDTTLLHPELVNGRKFYMAYKIPPRGTIYDRNGLALAFQTEATALYIQPDQIDLENAGKMYNYAGKLVGRYAGDIRAAVIQSSPQEWVPVGEIPREQAEADWGNLNNWPGLFVYNYPPSGELTRLYTYGFNSGSHAVGYTRYISEEEKPKYLEQGYLGVERVGVHGIELWGEEYLRGQAGASLVVLEADNTHTGIVLADSITKPSSVIETTLDRELQRVAQAALDGLPGAAVVVDIHTGAILAMASSPTVNPNLFDGYNINANSLAKITSNPDSVFLNRAAQAQIPAGSVFKVVTAAAALESGIFWKDRIVDCQYEWVQSDAGLRKGDWTLDHGEPPTGPVDAVRALKRSCNPYYYQAGYELFQWDANYLPNFAREFGFGRLTNIVGLDQAQGEELPGLVPDSDWASANSDGWTIGDNVNLAIGQGDLLVTPLQMAMAYAALANGGTLYRPYMVNAVKDLDGNILMDVKPEVVSTLPISPETLEIIREGMWEAVHNSDAPLGTAYWMTRELNLPVWGKTGTAENPPYKPYSWFAGFSTPGIEGKPDIAIVVMVERAGQGSEYAAPMFRRILVNYYLNKPGWYYLWEEDYGLRSELVPEETATPEGGDGSVPAETPQP